MWFAQDQSVSASEAGQHRTILFAKRRNNQITSSIFCCRGPQIILTLIILPEVT
jgi:hypothetical protein